MDVPKNDEQGCGATQPYPLVTQPLKNALHSLSVLALLLWLQTLSTHEVNGVAVLVFQHNFVPFNPLKLLHYA